MKTHCFVQARMSSNRFPGKVLFPFMGKPILAHVLDRLAQVVHRDNIVVLTSDEAKDDQIVEFCETHQAQAMRGPLGNVLLRFQMAVKKYQPDFFIRISADSPLIDPKIVEQFILEMKGNKEFDVLTNVFPRTFPKGQSVEIVKASTFLRIKSEECSEEEQEHVTQYFYNRPTRFVIRNIKHSGPPSKIDNFCIDYPADIFRLEKEVSVEE